VVKLHKLTAWFSGIWLAVICFSGSLLLFKTEWLNMMYPPLAKAAVEYASNQTSEASRYPTAALAEFTQRMDANPSNRYIIFASEANPWHQVVDNKGSHNYYNWQGEWLLTREVGSDWLDLLKQLHSHLLLDGVGENALGILALFGSVLIITGLFIWWPRHFSRRLFSLPLKANKAKTYRQWHTVMGLFSLPMMVLVLFTSLGLVYNAQFRTVLIEWFDNYNPPTLSWTTHPQSLSQPTPWFVVFNRLSAELPEAKPRILSLQQDRTAPMQIRFKLPEELHPNGRSKVYFEPQTGEFLAKYTARDMGTGETLMNMLYPLHIAAVGSALFQLLMALTGVIPLLMMILGMSLAQKKKRSRMNS
jgi:uncharacterized iron-regulated membrane protein